MTIIIFIGRLDLENVLSLPYKYLSDLSSCGGIMLISRKGGCEIWWGADSLK